MEQQNFLRNSECGRVGGRSVLVCCPNTLTINDLRAKEQCKVQVPDRAGDGAKNSTTDFPWYEIPFNPLMNSYNSVVLQLICL